ncbi:MAG: 50S ribosomal protein L6 [Saprospiraceae bacterium]|nr:50S ribosomal protein L6 [Saprospiraceae bacterium]MBK8669445.1 50S ribosomal protein L6 [Saprospiraceae bacterium]MBL0100782.1 50S ribosomal protein L6 [Saprospiraceae bacterium]
MSRIGKAVISIPSGVTVDISKGNLVTVKGTRGTLSEQINPDLSVSVENGDLTVARPTEQKRHREAHGLSRSLINNMVTGVSTGFTKQMELIGVGYRVSNTGNLLELLIGYSHPIYFMIPGELKLVTKMEKGENPTIILEGSDKQLLGQVCAKIRTYRKPEPYKGKGIKFAGEILRRKAGKTSGKK